MNVDNLQHLYKVPLLSAPHLFKHVGHCPVNTDSIRGYPGEIPPQHPDPVIFDNRQQVVGQNKLQSVNFRCNIGAARKFFTVLLKIV